MLSLHITFAFYALGLVTSALLLRKIFALRVAVQRDNTLRTLR